MPTTCTVLMLAILCLVYIEAREVATDAEQSHSTHYGGLNDGKGWLLPVFPHKAKPGKRQDIPHEFYIVVRDDEALSAPNIQHIQRINPDVKFHFFSPDEATAWMKEYFAGTSVLWAYEMINPLLIAAKIDLWRLAILWLNGGVYIDDDSFLGVPLASIIEADDEFIYGVESNPYHSCFVSDHLFGKHTKEALMACCHDGSTSEKPQQHVHKTRKYEANQMVNWLIFSRPQHAFLSEALRGAVINIGSAYRNETYITEEDIEKNKLMCSTGPGLLTAAVLAVIDHNNGSSNRTNNNGAQKLKFRNAGVDFKRYRGMWLSKHHLAIAKSGVNQHKHHTNLIQKDKVPLLKEFA